MLPSAAVSEGGSPGTTERREEGAEGQNGSEEASAGTQKAEKPLMETQGSGIELQPISPTFLINDKLYPHANSQILFTAAFVQFLPPHLRAALT